MRTPAFPAMHYDLADNEHGLTMRDYFAAKALPAILDQLSVHDRRDRENAGWIAYQIADEMMKAREE